MSGPIVRSGPSEQYSANWARAFGVKQKKKAAKTQKKKAPKRKNKSRSGK